MDEVCNTILGPIDYYHSIINTFIQIFEDWSKRDFNNFVNASARWGRDAIEEIAEEMEGKTIKEVRAYAEVFWDRYRELPSK